MGLIRRKQAGFGRFSKLLRFYAKTFLTDLGLGAYTTAIDGVAADLRRALTRLHLDLMVRLAR